MSKFVLKYNIKPWGVFAVGVHMLLWVLSSVFRNLWPKSLSFKISLLATNNLQQREQ